jgi:propanediol dehydratase small subunit
MLAATLIFVIVALVAGVYARRALMERMRRYYDRRCAGRAWHDNFPNTDHEEIRGFLSLFVRAFCLSEKTKLAFTPDDRLMDIYRTIYPRIDGADALECETLVADCVKAYGVDIRERFNEQTTLGDLFRITHERA